MQVNLGPLLDNLNHNVSMVKEITLDFLRDSKAALSRMDSAIKEENHRVLEAEIHTLKGLISHFDTGTIYEKCSSLLDDLRTDQPKKWKEYAKEVRSLKTHLKTFTTQLQDAVNALK